jgi:ketosteroid isomerase-like protein
MNMKSTALKLVAFGMVSLFFAGCASTEESDGHNTFMGRGGPLSGSDVGVVLDEWHHAASVGDIERYIGLMTEGAVFMGTDAHERWTRKEFRAYAEPHFADGHGWTYVARDRYVQTNAFGDVAWVDEILDHATYGRLRGTAVLRQNGDIWRIGFYSLTFLVPNEAVGDVLEVIQKDEGGSMDSAG